MDSKYEVAYWDYINGEEITDYYTDSLLKAYLRVKQLEKLWYCVSIYFHRKNRFRDS